MLKENTRLLQECSSLKEPGPSTKYGSTSGEVFNETTRNRAEDKSRLPRISRKLNLKAELALDLNISTYRNNSYFPATT